MTAVKFKFGVAWPIVLDPNLSIQFKVITIDPTLPERLKKHFTTNRRNDDEQSRKNQRTLENVLSKILAECLAQTCWQTDNDMPLFTFLRWRNRVRCFADVR